MRIILPVIAVFALATPVAAQSTTVTMSVDYSDLDLANPDDLARLGDRIEAGARDACTHDSSLSKALNLYDESCASDLIEAANAQIATEVSTVELAVN